MMKVARLSDLLMSVQRNLSRMISRAGRCRTDLPRFIRIRTPSVSCLVFALVITTACGPAAAELIQFKMTGHITVDFSLGTLPEGIYEGAPFEAYLSYDTATPDSSPDDPQRGLYSTVVSAENFLVFRAGPAEVRANDLWLWVGNNLEEGATLENGRPLWELPDDAFLMLTSPFTASFATPVHNYVVFRWRDATRTALDTDLLPSQLSLNDFEATWFEVTTRSLNPVDQFTIRGIVSDIVSVPEPDMLVLLLSIATYALCTTPRQRLRMKLQSSLW